MRPYQGRFQNHVQALRRRPRPRSEPCRRRSCRGGFFGRPHDGAFVVVVVAAVFCVVACVVKLVA
jgi:hypothetical protein